MSRFKTQRCKAKIKGHGTRCLSMALPMSEYCGKHSPLTELKRYHEKKLRELRR